MRISDWSSDVCSSDLVSCGIGGDCFAILWDGAKLHGLNSSGTAPAAWNVEYSKKKYGTDPNGLAQQPKRGWDTVTVPGVVAGGDSVHEKYGKQIGRAACWEGVWQLVSHREEAGA